MKPILVKSTTYTQSENEIPLRAEEERGRFEAIPNERTASSFINSKEGEEKDGQTDGRVNVVPSSGGDC